MKSGINLYKVVVLVLSLTERLCRIDSIMQKSDHKIIQVLQSIHKHECGPEYNCEAVAGRACKMRAHSRLGGARMSKLQRCFRPDGSNKYFIAVS